MTRDLPVSARAVLVRTVVSVVASVPDMGCMAILRGAFPTAMVAVTVRLSTSTIETSLEPSFVTKARRPSALDAL